MKKSVGRLVVWFAGLILTSLWAKAHASGITRVPLWSGEFWQGMTLVVVFCWMVMMVVRGTLARDLKMAWRLSSRYQLAQLRGVHRRLRARHRSLAETYRDYRAAAEKRCEACRLVAELSDPPSPAASCT